MGRTDGSSVDAQYDAFISYARDERETIVRPLYDHLTDMGLRIWFDEFEVTIGDRIQGSINQGMRNSDYGIVVLSEGFLNRRYPIWELEGFLTRQLQGGDREKVLLPLYYDIDEEVVGAYSPALANLHALTVTTDNVGTVADRLYDVIDQGAGETVSGQLDAESADDGVASRTEYFGDEGETDATSRLIDLGDEARVRGDSDEARGYFERGLELAREHDNHEGVVDSLNGLSRVATYLGEHDEARDYCERSMERARTVEYRQGIATSLVHLGSIANDLGAYDEAKDCFEQSLELARSIDDQEVVVDSLNGLGYVAHVQGDQDTAQVHLEQSLQLAGKHGYQFGLAKSLGYLGYVAESQHEYDEARRYLEQSLDLYREIGHRPNIALSLATYAYVASMLGEYKEARESYEQSLKIYRELGDLNGAERVREHLDDLDDLQDAMEGWEYMDTL